MVADRKLRLYFDTSIPNYLFVKERLDDSEAVRLIRERHNVIPYLVIIAINNRIGRCS
jgi:hypothetical protein